MKRISFWLIFIVGCTSYEDNLTVKLSPTSTKNSHLVDLNSVKTVDDLSELYCQVTEDNKSVRLILPYNFRTREFDMRAKTGIQVFGHPMYCFHASGWNRTLKYDVEEKKWITDYLDLIVSESLISNLDSLVKLNIMNYGYEPSLSDNPQNAIFEITAYPETDLKLLEDVMGKLAIAYQNFLTSKISNTLPIDSLRVEYPLNIMISESQSLPPVPIDTTFINEIEEKIEIDLSEGSIQHRAGDKPSEN